MAKEYTLKIYPPRMSREIYRVIRIPGNNTLDDLCEVILKAYDFIHEHLYEFCMDNRLYGDDNYQYDPDDGGPSTDIKLDKIHLHEGQNFLLHYDYGDDWVFVIHVQKILKETALEKAEIIKGKGELEQYPELDWDEYEDDEE